MPDKILTGASSKNSTHVSARPSSAISSKRTLAEITDATSAESHPYASEKNTPHRKKLKTLNPGQGQRLKNSVSSTNISSREIIDVDALSSSDSESNERQTDERVANANLNTKSAPEQRKVPVTKRKPKITSLKQQPIEQYLRKMPELLIRGDSDPTRPNEIPFYTRRQLKDVIGEFPAPEALDARSVLINASDGSYLPKHQYSKRVGDEKFNTKKTTLGLSDKLYGLKVPAGAREANTTSITSSAGNVVYRHPLQAGELNPELLVRRDGRFVGLISTSLNSEAVLSTYGKGNVWWKGDDHVYRPHDLHERYLQGVRRGGERAGASNDLSGDRSERSEKEMDDNRNRSRVRSILSLD